MLDGNAKSMEGRPGSQEEYQEVIGRRCRGTRVFQRLRASDAHDRYRGLRRQCKRVLRTQTRGQEPIRANSVHQLSKLIQVAKDWPGFVGLKHLVILSVIFYFQELIPA